MVQRDEERIDWHVGKGREARTYFDSIRFGPMRKAYPNGSGVWMWRAHLLPGFPDEAIVSLREGHTDLFEPPDWFKEQIGLKGLLLKLEGQMPSASFKDRGMCLAVSDVLRMRDIFIMRNPDLPPRERYRKWLALCASTGDTSASAAMYAAYARDRLECMVILPSGGVSGIQAFQTRASGATNVHVDDPRGFDACMDVAEQFCARHPQSVLLNSENPMRLVGQESIPLEVCQDLGWKVPDWFAIPCGNGGDLTAFLDSLTRMFRRGLIDRLPGIIVAQAEVANTLVRWGRSGFRTYEPGVHKQSVASAMNIQSPVSFRRIAKLHGPFRMLFYDVPEAEIESTRGMWLQTGVSICPQSAVALNAVMQARDAGEVKENDVVVAISTASGLKFPTEKGLRFNEFTIPASVDALDEQLKLRVLSATV